MQSNDAVIEACLQAACIRAAATLCAGSRPSFPIAPENTVDHVARSLYVDATREPWKRGDAR